jgi:radical SAM superfamily enzyme YgiQ (UPF0313 family)
MNILLVYPQYPDTFWSFKHALRFIRKKAAFPPLGLLTVAAMLPPEWHKKVIDINVQVLTDVDIRWADYVFISAMVIQRSSVKEVINRVKKMAKKIVAGGPLFTADPEQFDTVDYLVLNEAELTLPGFLSDLAAGKAQHLYTTAEHPAVTQTPVPLWSLINMNNYSSMSLQYSRGCPFNCEFCDITFLDGRIPRTKSQMQVTAELEAIYYQGWRGSLFIVDDNFIGNKAKLKAETLPTLIQWQKRKRHPFSLFTEASINLVDDEELMQLMTQAGFNRVFVGIETPNEESLNECNKNQNTSRDLLEAVRKLHNHGLEVMAGFIVGFDSDPASIFKTQINFIQKSGIVTAMVGLLNAPRGTRLYQRLKGENRLLNEDMSGDNMDFSLNFVPKMNQRHLIEGYRNVLSTIYSPKHYYDRVKTLLREYRPKAKARVARLKFNQILGLINSVWFLGIREQGRRYYWKLFASTLLTRPRSFPMFVTLSVYGYHFRKVVNKYIGNPANSKSAI